jgi:hypothetical protein
MPDIYCRILSQRCRNGVTIDRNKGGLWEDAAFIAERILSADELKAYVDKLPPAAALVKPETNTGAPTEAVSENNSPDDFNGKLRNLLGRRLVREDRYEEAAKYLASPYDKGRPEIRNRP